MTARIIACHSGAFALSWRARHLRTLMALWITLSGTSTALPLDALLCAVETLPGIDDASWDLDCLRTALRLARASEAPGALERAGLAYQALNRENRDRLLRHITEAAQQRPARPAPVADGRRSGRLIGALAAWFGDETPSGGATARDRLLRELAGQSPPATGG